MQVNLIVIDEFYNNPDDVRSFALNQPFTVKGNYPGIRTKTFLNESTQFGIESAVAFAGGKVTNWNIQDGLTGSFQIATAADRSWIHSDNFNTWGGICYLTPDAPLSSGTGIYRHRSTGRTQPLSREDKHDYDWYDYTKWEMIDRVGNVYNRLILFRGDRFHASLDYFGNNLENGRLFQVFFFDTEH